jgi:periplasmic divalent cation tolerance protein
MIVLYVPCKDNQEAATISKELVTRKLVACTNLIPIASWYLWEGTLTEDAEVVLLAKTTEKKADSAAAAIKQLHSYDIPCILRLQVGCNSGYSSWMGKALK